MNDSDPLLAQAASLAQQYLQGVDDRPVRATAGVGDIQARLGGTLAADGEDALAVVQSLAASAQEATVATQGRRYFGFVTGGSLPVATAADWLVSAWDQNAALHVMSPLISTVEDITNGWIRDILGLAHSWSVGYVTGATMANFTALAAARHHVLAAVGWNVEADGLFGAPVVEVVVSEEAHYTIASALRMLGLGGERVHKVATDDQGRMRVDALAAVLQRLSGPCIVCAQAGNVNTGALDPVDDIATLVRERGAWLHVDGAFGLWAAASPALRHLVAGVELADSITTDAHKWLNVPYDCGIVLCAHPEAHRSAMTLAAPYIKDTAGQRDSRAYVPEESHRARVVPVYAVLRTLGSGGLRDLVERCCRHARRFGEGLAEAGNEVLNDIVLNQVLVAFGDDDTTHRVIAGIQEDGTCWCGGTRWHGRAAMRISVSSWATTEADVERSLAAMLRVAGQVR